MKVKSLSSSLLIASLVLAHGPAQAVDTGIDWLKVSGFGTVALTRSSLNDSDGVTYAPTFTTTPGVRNSWSSSIDSRLGLQATAQLGQQVSATLQVLRRRTAEGDYHPTAEWANIKYEFNPDLSVRVGRVGLPVFMISDYLNVGYAQPWIRPPVDVYKFMPYTHLDGADAIVRFHAGDANITVQPFFGRSEFQSVTLTLANVGILNDIHAKDIIGASVGVEYGPLTVRYTNMHDSNTSKVVFGQREMKDNFNNLGLVYDKDSVLVQGEYVWRITSESDIGKLNQQMAYLTGGYRFGTVMPNLTFSRFIDNSTLGLFGTTQNTVGLGVRWDCYKNVAFKAQLDHITRSSGKEVPGVPGVPGAPGLFRALSLGNQFSASTDKSVNVLSLGFDFVF